MRSRPYYVSSGPVAIGAGGTAVCALYGLPSSGFGYSSAAVRCYVVATGSSPSSNGSLQVQLAQASGTAGGGGSVTPQTIGQGSSAAKSTWTSASAAAITGLTQGAEYWSGSAVLAPAGFAGEQFLIDLERYASNSAPLSVWLTPSVTPTTLSAVVTVDFGE